MAAVFATATVRNVPLVALSLPNASPALQWAIIRKHHSHMISHDGYTFSSEPNNLLNRHSFKFSGLVNPHQIGVHQRQDKSIHLSKKRMHKDTLSHPLKSTLTIPLRRHIRDRRLMAGHTIGAQTVRSHYRPDLSKFAVARYSALHRAANIKPDRYVNKKKAKKAKGDATATTEQAAPATEA